MYLTTMHVDVQIHSSKPLYIAKYDWQGRYVSKHITGRFVIVNGIVFQVQELFGNDAKFVTDGYPRASNIVAYLKHKI